MQSSLLFYIHKKEENIQYNKKHMGSLGQNFALTMKTKKKLKRKNSSIFFSEAQKKNFPSFSKSARFSDFYFSCSAMSCKAQYMHKGEGGAAAIL